MDYVIDKLGIIIRSARLEADMTRKELANKLDITERHLMYIENNQQKPSYKLLFRLIRELSIPSDTIFYPEITYESHSIEHINIMLRQCDEKKLNFLSDILPALLAFYIENV